MCRKCNKRHHTLSHIDRENQTAYDKGSISNKNLSADTRVSITADVNTRWSYKGKLRNHILLATAIAEVQNKSGQYVPCRALLDSGSQSSFITDRCVQRLRLSRTQTHASIQGISNVNTATQHSVSIQLRSRHTGWHTTVDCAILSNITGTTPSSKLGTSSWMLPKDNKFAGEQFNQPGGIDLLIGADLFYEVFQPGRSTRHGNYPVPQETILGWTVCGRTPAATQNGSQYTFLSREDKSLKSNLNRFWEAEPVEQSTMTAEQQACEELPNKMGPNLIETSSLSEETDHSDPANFQEGRKTSYCLPYPVFKTKGSTIRTTWIASNGGAKSTGGTQHASFIPDGKGP